MKTNRLGRLVVVVAIIVGVAGVRAAPLGTGFIYQGQLKSGGSPANGEYDLQFKLSDAAVGGILIGPVIQLNNVSVTNGLFNVTLDFGARFDGDARWLEVGVHPGVLPVADPYTLLSPRQALSATPYALGLRLPFAQTTATNSDVFNITTTGAGDGFQFNITNPASAGEALEGRTDGTGNSVQGVNTGTGRAGFFQISNAANGSAALYAATNGTGPALVADGSVGIGTSAPGRTLQVGNTVVSNTEGMIRLASRSGTQGSNRIWDIGVPETDADSSGIGYSFVIDDTQSGSDPEFMVKFGSGRVGIGTTAPGHLLDVGGRMRVRESTSSAGIWLYQTAPAADRAFVGMYDDDTVGLYGTTGASWILLMDTTTGNVGIDTSTPEARLQIVNGTDSEPVGGGFLVLGGTTGANISIDDNEIMARNNGAVSTLYLNNDGGDVVIARGATTTVSVLAITGADLAEKFPVSEKVEPGMVMEIDPDQPGQLRLARGVYNRRVAGVVSGANGLSAGAILGNLPGHEDAPAIALSGRVWVHCDASNGPIQPGDLLTTADTPGHAMKATDYPRAQGAIIGKSMTGLETGSTGLVLVLVNLQ